MLTMAGKDILMEGEFSGEGEALLIINGLLGCGAGWRHIFTTGMTMWFKFIFVCLRIRIQDKNWKIIVT